MPVSFLNRGTKKLVQSYMSTAVPSSLETSWDTLHTADHLCNLSEAVSEAAEFCSPCFRRPKHQSGANLVWPTTINDMVILVCRPVMPSGHATPSNANKGTGAYSCFCFVRYNGRVHHEVWSSSSEVGWWLHLHIPSCFISLIWRTPKMLVWGKKWVLVEVDPTESVHSRTNSALWSESSWPLLMFDVWGLHSDCINFSSAIVTSGTIKRSF